jgi:hypothetical protein
MTTTTSRTHSLPSRGTLRARCAGTVRLQSGRERGGYARIVDAGLGGLGIETGVDLPAGTHVLVEVNDPDGDGRAELKGKVTWVRTSNDGIRCGIRIYEDDASVRAVLTALVQSGLKAQSNELSLAGRQRLLVDLAMAARAVDESPSVWQRLTPSGQWNIQSAINAGF